MYAPIQSPHQRARRAANNLSAALTKCTAILDLNASTAVGGEWTSIVDIKNSNPAAQADADRAPAVGTANGQATAVFDGTDVMPGPSAASNSPTTKRWVAFWMKPTSNVATRQRLIFWGPAAASANQLFLDIASGNVSHSVYNGAFTGRAFNSSGGITASAWQFFRFAFDSLGASEALQVLQFIDEASLAVTGGDIGAGGALVALPTVTGSALIGASSDSDTPSSPMLNGFEIGPRIHIGSTPLTAPEGVALMNVSRPKA